MFRWTLPLWGLVALAGVAVACDGLSPGDQLVTEGGLCTLAFIVASPDALYFSTAGHCIQVGESASSPDHEGWGEGAFHFLEPETGSPQDGSPGKDFALIEIHPDAYPSLNPKVCGWDGPTGIYNETPGGGGVRHWGHGTVFGDLGPTGQRREGYQMTNDGEAFYWLGAGVPGDSGSAVLAEDGRALGVLTHLNVGFAAAGPVTNGGTHIEHGFRLAANESFRDLRLVLMGEDPVAVMMAMRDAKRAAETPVGVTLLPAEPGGTPPKTDPTPPTRPTTTPPAANPDDSAPLAPAATDEPTDPGAKNTPVPPALALVALVLALVVVRARGADRRR